MAIRRIGVVTTEPESELIPIEEAASRLGIHPTTLRQWMRLDMEDGKGRVPGGRCAGRNYVVIRAVFERAMRHGIEPEHPQPSQRLDMSGFADLLDRIAADIRTRAS